MTNIPWNFNLGQRRLKDIFTTQLANDIKTMLVYIYIYIIKLMEVKAFLNMY